MLSGSNCSEDFRFSDKYQIKMLNLDIAVSSFWQLARHWKSGESAKLELECEGGNLNIQLSARLGHTDSVHFPAPSPALTQSSCKRKSPSKLRRQKRRQEEAIHEAENANPMEENVSHQSEKSVDTHPEEAVPIPEEGLVHKPAEKPAKQSLQFKCEHCDYRVSCKAKLTKHINTEYKEDYLNGIHSTPTLIPYQSDQCSFVGVSDKGLKQHTRLSHRISQLDGNISEPEDNTLVK